MGRKRKGVPERLDPTKQQRLVWNMTDMMAPLPEGSNSCIPGLVDDGETLEASGNPFLSRNISNPLGSPAHLFDKTMTEIGVAKRDQAINKCDFYIEINRDLPKPETNWCYVLGTFKINIKTPIIGSHTKLPDELPTDTEIWFYVNKDSNEHLVYVEKEDARDNRLLKLENMWVMYFEVICDVSSGCFDGIRDNEKQLTLLLDTYDPATATIEVKILATESIIVQLQYSTDSPRVKKFHPALQHVFSYTHKFPLHVYPWFSPSEKHDTNEFYMAIKELHRKEEIMVDLIVQHPNLRPRLRQYQKNAVVWMLHRENFTGIPTAENKTWVDDLYEEIRIADGSTFFYNKHSGFLIRDKPVATANTPGGILADEMGLGKTVEVLACIMCHPRPELPPVEPLPIVTPQPSTVESDDQGSNESESPTTVEDTNDVTENKNKELKKEDADIKIEQELIPENILEKKQSELKTEIDSALDQTNVNISPKTIALDHDYCGVTTTITTPESSCSPSPADETPSSGGKGKSRGKGKACNKNRAKNTGSFSPEEKSPKGKQSKRRRVSKIKDEPEVNSTKSQEDVEEVKIIPDVQNNDLDSIPREEEKSETPTTPLAIETKVKRKRPRSGYVEIVEIKEEPGKDNKLGKQKSTFECLCGTKDHKGDGKGGEIIVACVMCGLRQHAACMKYDLTNPLRGEYKCPHCHAISPPIPSRATLIISPVSISEQWGEEIRKHIIKERLKVFVYSGVHIHGYMQPRFLADHDIVITTYEMLQREMNYVDLPHSNSDVGRRFRHPKRFMATPSPIVAVEWWRICLDEAQMVEGTTTKSAEMALRLSAINRWCVTGTPIQKRLDDLYGLMLFLGEAPYWVQPWWQRVLFTPYCFGDKKAMHEAISKVMWRTCKSDVLDQICLPTQSEEVHWLDFSPVEEHFYKRTSAQCARTGLMGLDKWQDGTIKLNSLDRRTLHALLSPLGRLRQACCHPQAVRGSYLPIQKSMMTMEEVLISMTKKARQECEEAHRQLVAAMNGQAGLHIIKNNYTEAVDMYRNVLRSIGEQKDQFRTDPLQKLHTLHNLQEILSLKPEGVHPTLRDDKLKEEAADLRAKYLLKAASFVTAAQDAWSPLRTSLKDARKDMRGHDDWWADLLQWILYIGSDELLVERIRSDLQDNRQMNNTTLANSFRDIRGLEYVLEGELESLTNAHTSLIERITTLQKKPTPELICQTVTCCLRPDNPDKPLKTCVFCKTDELFDVLENKLFSFKDKGVTEVSGLEGSSTFQVGTRRQGTWADSEMERILKSLIGFCRSYSAAPTSDTRPGTKLVDIGAAHIKVFENMKKEFKVLRTMWIELKAQVSAHDELDMATTRLRLRLEDEPVPDPPLPHILEPAEFDCQQMKLKSDIIIAKNLLTRKMGQLVYLKNLAKTQTNMEGGENAEPCPICQRALGKKWALFTCGHSFCLDCIRQLIDEYSLGGLVKRTKCPLCRQLTEHKDINYVSMVSEDQRTNEIKGDHSTKIEGIVRCVLDILNEDQTTKILIFSLWQNVLSIIEQALRDNHVSFLSLTSNKFQRNLSDFKSQPSISVLLLPVHSGANGLNLIEATHLLLVEPILNPSQELQAVGRIHRIGQTKPTFVHRFLVRNTIEERLHHLLAVRGTNMTAVTNNADDTPFTMNDLRSLFLESRKEHPDMDEENDGISDENNEQVLAEAVPEMNEPLVGEASDPTETVGNTIGNASVPTETVPEMNEPLVGEASDPTDTVGNQIGNASVPTDNSSHLAEAVPEMNEPLVGEASDPTETVGNTIENASVPTDDPSPSMPPSLVNRESLLCLD